MLSPLISCIPSATSIRSLGTGDRRDVFHFCWHVNLEVRPSVNGSRSVVKGYHPLTMVRHREYPKRSASSARINSLALPRCVTWCGVFTAAIRGSRAIQYTRRYQKTSRLSPVPVPRPPVPLSRDPYDRVPEAFRYSSYSYKIVYSPEVNPWTQGKPTRRHIGPRRRIAEWSYR